MWGLIELKGAQSPFLRSTSEGCGEDAFLEWESLSRKRPKLLWDPHWGFGDEVPRRIIKDPFWYMHYLPSHHEKLLLTPEIQTCTNDNTGIPQLLITGGTKALWGPFSSTAPLVQFCHSSDRLKVQKRQLSCATLSSQLRMFKAGLSSHQFLFQPKRLNTEVKSNRQKQFHLKWIGKPSVSTLLFSCPSFTELTKRQSQGFPRPSQTRTASF